REMVAGGVQLCLSQYSYGPEANALLGQLPLGYVRLAARYSSQLHEPAVRDEMRSAIDHAHRLGLQVIGQQVEDAQSAATLWMTGVDFIQGNLVQRPAGELEFDFHNSVLYGRTLMGMISTRQPSSAMLRWFTLGAAGGAAVTMALHALGLDGPWLGVALVMALLAAFAAIAVFYNIRVRERELREAQERTQRDE